MKNKLFLKEFCADEVRRKNNLDLIWDRIFKKIQPYQNEIEKNIKKMGHFEMEDLPDLNLKDIYNEYQNIWETHKTLKGIKTRELKKYFSILFSNPNEGVPKGLYDRAEQFDDFLRVIIQRNKQSYLKRLISDLLYYYPKDRGLLFKRLKEVHDCLDKNKGSNISLLKANMQFRLTQKDAPSLIAKAILNTNRELSSGVLSEIWLKERHLLNGIGAAIVKELRHLVKTHIKEENEIVLKRFLQYLSKNESVNWGEPNPNQEIELKDKRFNDPTPIVSVLLRSFEDKMPRESIQKMITQFLDQYVGDPRFESEKWINMDEEREIFLKWKIGETIKDFLSLLSYTARKNPDADRMWPYRKKFIEDYWKNGHIRNAWVVLGKEAYDKRHKFLKRNFDNYGRIIKGAHSIHSVLLFQIGDLILSEWNYNGKVRIWHQNKHAPQFYKTEYSREDFINKPKKEFIHRSPEKYYWQQKLSEYIERYTDIRCPEELEKKIYRWS